MLAIRPTLSRDSQPHPQFSADRPLGQRPFLWGRI